MEQDSTGGQPDDTPVYRYFDGEKRLAPNNLGKFRDYFRHIPRHLVNTASDGTLLITHPYQFVRRQYGEPLG